MFNFSRISALQAKQMMDAGEVTLIDIRDEASFQAGHMSKPGLKAATRHH